MTKTDQSDPTTRPVLLWHADTDDSRTFPTPADAASFLHTSPEEVLSAISSGNPLNNYFADWQPTPAHRPV
jgi:hypothetical protein